MKQNRASRRVASAAAPFNKETEMSCFIVSAECMAKVLTMAFVLSDAGKLTHLCGVPVNDAPVQFLAARKLWSVLYSVNQDAFNARYEGRYPDEAVAPPYEYIHESKTDRAAFNSDTLVALAKAVEALLYQCTETPINSTAAYAELVAFRDAANEYALACYLSARSLAVPVGYDLRNTAAWENAAWG